LIAARQKAATAQADVNRLQGIIDAVAPAQQKLQAAIAKDGGKALARFTAGNRGEKIGELIAAVDAASRGALAARDALPEAERILADAGARIARAEEEKRSRVRDVLIEQADDIGRRYVEGFIELSRLNGELIAFAEGVRLLDVIVTTQQMEVPRFNLPSMSTLKPLVDKGISHHGLPSDDTVYSPFLKYRVDRNHLDAQRGAWARFAAALLSDVNAEFGGQGTDDIELSPGLIRHPRQRRQERSVNEVLYGGKR
jgi:hypothetical protein